MERISHRELRNNSGEILRQVQEGKVFEITNNGVVVAQIVAPQHAGRLNVAIPASSNAPLSEYAPIPLPGGKSVVDILIEERDRERGL